MRCALIQIRRGGGGGVQAPGSLHKLKYPQPPCVMLIRRIVASNQRVIASNQRVVMHLSPLPPIWDTGGDWWGLIEICFAHELLAHLTSHELTSQFVP